MVGGDHLKCCRSDQSKVFAAACDGCDERKTLSASYRAEPDLINMAAFHATWPGVARKLVR